MRGPLCDELEHAELVSRWIVDLGSVPPTDMPCVEQFCGSTDEAIHWLIEAEVVGIHKYNAAHALSCGLPGLHLGALLG